MLLFQRQFGTDGQAARLKPITFSFLLAAGSSPGLRTSSPPSELLFESWCHLKILSRILASGGNPWF